MGKARITAVDVLRLISVSRCANCHHDYLAHDLRLGLGWCAAEAPGLCWCPGWGAATQEAVQARLQLNELQDHAVAPQEPVDPEPRADVEADEALDRAWGIIANAARGDWTREHPDWQAAATRWRDSVLPGLSARRAARLPEAAVAPREPVDPEPRAGVEPEWPDLANDIRMADGNHDLGAGALAAALVQRGWTRRPADAERLSTLAARYTAEYEAAQGAGPVALHFATDITLAEIRTLFRDSGLAADPEPTEAAEK